MSSNRKIKMAKYGYIIISTLICILGISLIIIPQFSVTLLCKLGGLLLVFFGIVKILGYISKDLYRLAFQHDLAFGILLIALGSILIFKSNIMIQFICIILGIFVLADALLKVQISIDSKMFGIRQWWLIMTAAIITGIIGFLLIFHPTESAKIIMILLGMTLLSEGILNFITIFNVVKIYNNNTMIDFDNYRY